MRPGRYEHVHRCAPRRADARAARELHRRALGALAARREAYRRRRARIVDRKGRAGGHDEIRVRRSASLYLRALLPERPLLACGKLLGAPCSAELDAARSDAHLRDVAPDAYLAACA